MLETDATVCEIDAHFRHKYLTHKTMRRQQKYTQKLSKIKIDARIFDFETQIFFIFQAIRNGSNAVFKPFYIGRGRRTRTLKNGFGDNVI